MVLARQTNVRAGFWAPPLDFAGFRKQEAHLILLNLASMAGLMSLHAVFRRVLGPLSAWIALAFVLRFAMQMGEVTFLNRGTPMLSARATWWYARFSVLANIGFAALVSMPGHGQENNHYAVLMVVPVIAAAFRFTGPGLAMVLAATIGLTIGYLWLPAAGAPESGRLTETFEATTVSLIFLVVATVVRLLATQLWRREDELVREQKLAAIGRIASAIAHEVRNPVSMIVSALNAARSPSVTPQVRAEVLGIISEESTRLQRLTEDFLAYARNRKPQLRQTSLSDAIALAAGVLAPRATECGVALETRCQDARVALDPFQVQQALLNLGLNSLDATPRGGTLRLSAQAGRGRVAFVVENSGPAIPPEAVARLGEPFFSTKRTGTGLGLAITRSIAEAHGGDLRLAANEPGRVRFELRISVPEAR